jgi:hypothetical protein
LYCCAHCPQFHRAHYTQCPIDTHLLTLLALHSGASWWVMMGRGCQHPTAPPSSHDAVQELLLGSLHRSRICN